MKKFVLASAFVFSVFAISACAVTTYGPTANISDAGYVQAVQAAVDSTEAIQFMDKVYVLPHTKKPGFGQTWGAFGTLVVTDKTLYFLFWNRNANTFDVLRKLPLADILNVKHISSVWGPGDYVSIEDKDGRFDLWCCWEMYNTSSEPIKNNQKFMKHLDAARNAK